MNKNNFIISKNITKLLLKQPITTNWDEVYQKIVRTRICFLNISKVCMFPAYQRKEKERKIEKEREKQREHAHI